MAFLTVPVFGDVPVALDPAAAVLEYDEVGGRERAYSGAMHSTIRARPRKWTIRTRPMLRADGDSLVSALEGTQPLACSGDLLGGAVSCHYEPVRTEHPKFQPGEHQAITFILHEQ